MTGQEFRQQFETRIDEVGSGFYDDTRLNNLIQSALLKIIDPKVEQYALTKKITREMDPIISMLSSIPVINGTVDVSATSVVVPTFYSEIEISVTSPYNNATLTKSATILNLNEKVSYYSAGKARIPKYFIAQGLINVQPVNATLIDIIYFIAPVYIDVADNSVQIPYNAKLIDLLIDMTIELASESSRDDYLEVKSTEQVLRNP